MWITLPKFIFFFLLIQRTVFGAEIGILDGDWYSYKWKYGYTLKNGKGTATITNSPSFKVGQEIVRLAQVGENSFVGENIYKDGIFYKVKVTLQPNGRLFFEGEKNVKWEMERISEKTLQSLLAEGDLDRSSTDIPYDVLRFIERRDTCEHFFGEAPYDKDRLAFLEWSICKYCFGTDSDLANLKEKYKKNHQVLSHISGYAASVEPLSRSKFTEACRKVKKPKSYE